MIDFGKTNFVKVYLYDDTDWNRVGNEGRCLQLLLWRKFDREGGADVDADPEERIRDIADLVRAPEEFVRVGLEALLRRKMLILQAGPEGKARLVDPTFKTAQETRQSSTQRSRNHRERKAEERNEAQRDATSGDAPQQGATDATPRIEETRREETRSDEIRTPLSPKGAGAGGGKVVAVNGVEALAAIRAAAGERLSFGEPAATETGLPGGDWQGSEGAWMRAWREQGKGYTLADCAKLGAWLKAGGWGHLQGSVSVAFLTGHLTEALQSALGWDGAPLGKARASPGGGSKPPPMVRP